MRFVIIAFCCAVAAPAQAQTYTSFVSPSGNISCMAAQGAETWVRCDIREYTPTYTSKPADCNLDWGGSFFLPAVGAGQVGCVGDTVIDPSATVLGYGQSWDFGGVICYSEQTGMTCQNNRGNGFLVRRADQAVY